MKAVRRLLLVIPVLFHLGCSTDSNDGARESEDASEGRTRDLTSNQTVDQATDPIVDQSQDSSRDVTADPTPDPVVDVSPDPVVDTRPDPTIDAVTDSVSDPRPDPAVDPVTDFGGGDFDACISGFLSGGVTAAYGYYSSDYSSTYVGHFWDDSDTYPTMELVVEVYTDYGGPTIPGTYVIDETEADYATCGLCILAFTETEVFMPVPNSGTVTITAITTGDSVVGSTFAGSLDVTMREVEIDSSTFETTVVRGGCTGDLSHNFSDIVQDYYY